MATIQGELKNVLGSLSITGNTMMDSMILMNIIPFVMAYTTSILGLFKSIGSAIFYMIVNWVKQRIKSRFVGTLLLKVVINDKNELYKHIKVVFDNKYDFENEDTKSKFVSISDYFEEEDASDEFPRRSYFYNYHFDAKLYDAEVNYGDDGLLNVSKRYGAMSRKTKVFTYKDKYIKFTLNEQKATGSDKKTYVIVIEVLSFSKKKDDENNVIRDLEEFIQNKLCINETLHFVYTVGLKGKEIYDHLFKIATNAGTPSSGYLHSIGNGKISMKVKNDVPEKNTYSNKNISINMKTNNFSKERNYFDDIEIVASNNNDDVMDSLTGNTGINKVYSKFINRNGLDNSNAKYVCYFIHNNIIYFMKFLSGFTMVLHIISFGKKLKEADVKTHINLLIKLGHDCDKRINSSTVKLIVKNEVYIQKRIRGEWTRTRMDKRTFDTVYLPIGTINAVRKEFDDFIEMEKIYSMYQIPYKKGILFYGPPGTGKTSFVKALAYEYQMDIYLLDVNNEEVNDDSIVDILNSLGSTKNRILLFEDIDTAFANKEKLNFETKSDEEVSSENNDENKKKSSNKKFLTYSGLLNALDGVLSNQNGVITIMTTNYIDKLGDAFIRPGRIDTKYELKECNQEQICRMISSFIEKRQSVAIYGTKLTNIDWEDMDRKTKEFAMSICDEQGQSKIKPCALQFYILKHLQNVEDIFKHRDQLMVM